MRKIFLILILSGLALFTAWSYFIPQPERALIVSGTIEARPIRIGSKIGGRIAAIHISEGARVQKGALLVVFEAESTGAALDQARAQYAEATAQLSRLENGSRVEEIAEARAIADKDHGMRNAEVDQARAELERARTEMANAERAARRASALQAQNLIAKQEVDDRDARWRAQQAAVRAAEQALRAAEARLSAARAITRRTESGYRVEDIAAAKAVLERTGAAVRAAEVNYAEREVRAPADAQVEVFEHRVGDLIAPNAILARLLEDNQRYVMVYVPETRIHQVTVGQSVQVRIPAFSDPFPGQVEQIRAEAEFLPRNVQTPEERVHQVIGVKIGLGAYNPRLHPGMTALVEFPL